MLGRLNLQLHGRAPMAVGSQKILAELVDHISHKQNLYRSAYSADLKRLEITHGSAAITEALQLVEHNNAQHNASRWDAPGHAVEVRNAIGKLLTSFHEREE
jgi:hypothetical protein